MSKIKPQIKKNNPSKSHFSTGWNVFGAVCLIGRKNNHELFKNLTL
ncbi:hypothetical protein [Helicobacter pylori]